MFETRIVNGQKLLKLRLAKKLSQTQLAEKADCSKRTIERAEKNASLRPKVITQIAKVFNVRMVELILEEEPGNLRATHSSYLAYLRDEFEDLHHFEIKTVDPGALQSDYDPKLEDLFIQPYLLSHAVSPEAARDSWDGFPLAETILAEPGAKVILGDPGSGKSTLIAWTALQLTAANPFSHALGDRIPVPLILRELNLREAFQKPEFTWEDLIRAFQEWCGKHKQFAETVKGDRLFQLIRDGNAVLLLDGLDEISTDARRAIREAIWQLLRLFPKNVVICTSRPVGYEEVPFDRELAPRERHGVSLPSASHSHTTPEDNATEADDDSAGLRRAALEETQRMQRLYLAPFDLDQIGQFVHHWYLKRLVSKGRSLERAEGMLAAIRANHATLTLARIPNILTIMAILHERRNVLPDGRSKLYAAVAELYLVQIDQLRGIVRDKEIRATTSEQKLWLGRVAWEIQQRRAANEDLPKDQKRDNTSILLVTYEELRQWITAEARDPDNPPALSLDSDITAFIRKIQEQAGLVIERGHDRYSFIHLSFIEYFAGHYLLHSFETDLFRFTPGCPLKTLPTRVLWHETLIFAVEEARETLTRKRIPLVRQLVPWFDPVTCEAQPLTNGQDQQSLEARSNCWILLTRLGEDRHTGFEQQQTPIRTQCEAWAAQVDPVHGKRESRENRFTGRWLAEIHDPDFPMQFWTRTFGLTTHSVKELNLGGNGIGAAGAEALARAVEAGGLPQLTELYLEGNGIGDAGAEALARAVEAGGLPQLTVLLLGDNGIGAAGAEALRKRFARVKNVYV